MGLFSFLTRKSQKRVYPKDLQVGSCFKSAYYEGNKNNNDCLQVVKKTKILNGIKPRYQIWTINPRLQQDTLLFLRDHMYREKQEGLIMCACPPARYPIKRIRIPTLRKTRKHLRPL
jgi:hypothetical protein